MKVYKVNLNVHLKQSLSTGVIQCSAEKDISGYKTFERIKKDDLIVVTEKARVVFICKALADCIVLDIPKLGKERQVPFDVLLKVSIHIKEFDSTEFFAKWVSKWVKESRGEVSEEKHRNSFRSMQFCTELKYLKVQAFLKKVQEKHLKYIEQHISDAEYYEELSHYCNGNQDAFYEASINSRRVADDLSETLIRLN